MHSFTTIAALLSLASTLQAAPTLIDRAVAGDFQATSTLLDRDVATAWNDDAAPEILVPLANSWHMNTWSGTSCTGTEFGWSAPDGFSCTNLCKFGPRTFLPYLKV